MIPVTLAQSDDTGPAQTVRAFSYRQPGKLGWSAISFAVPSPEALLGNMSENLGFVLTVDRKQVMAIKWSGGSAAREKLRQCVAGGKPA